VKFDLELEVRRTFDWRVPLVVTFGLLAMVGCAGEGTEGVEARTDRSSASEATCRDAIDVLPTYLPWIDAGGQVPAPVETYDRELDRAQLSWQGGNELGIGLTVYPHAPLGNMGHPTTVEVHGATGHLHLQDEGGLIGVSWDLPGRRCNYLELSFSSPGVPKSKAVDELMRVASSLRPA
jgi:hypothetical protein